MAETAPGVADPVLAELFAALRPARTTLRMDVPGMNFPCVAEVVADGQRAMTEDNSIDQRAAATATWVMETRKVLVQPDVSAGPPPPEALVTAYGVRAQVLAPIVAGQESVGWLSVHSDRPRAWTSEEVASIALAAELLAAHTERIRAEPGYRRWLGEDPR